MDGHDQGVKQHKKFAKFKCFPSSFLFFLRTPSAISDRLPRFCELVVDGLTWNRRILNTIVGAISGGEIPTFSPREPLVRECNDSKTKLIPPGWVNKRKSWDFNKIERQI